MTNPTAEITTAQAAKTPANPQSIPLTRAALALYGYQKFSFANHISDSDRGRNTASTNDSPARPALIAIVRRRSAPATPRVRAVSYTHLTLPTILRV